MSELATGRFSDDVDHHDLTDAQDISALLAACDIRNHPTDDPALPDTTPASSIGTQAQPRPGSSPSSQTHGVTFKLHHGATEMDRHDSDPRESPPQGLTGTTNTDQEPEGLCIYHNKKRSLCFLTPIGDTGTYHCVKPNECKMPRQTPTPKQADNQVICSVHGKSRSVHNMMKGPGLDDWQCQPGSQCRLEKSGTPARRSPNLAHPFALPRNTSSNFSIGSDLSGGHDLTHHLDGLPPMMSSLAPAPGGFAGHPITNSPQAHQSLTPPMPNHQQVVVMPPQNSGQPMFVMVPQGSSPPPQAGGYMVQVQQPLQQIPMQPGYYPQQPIQYVVMQGPPNHQYPR